MGHITSGTTHVIQDINPFNMSLSAKDFSNLHVSTLHPYQTTNSSRGEIIKGSTCIRQASVRSASVL
ncbi:hypothetical protein Mapa_007533 [Marchantia paleacea]|nr:hypothetical protein Mapa_007533 [Marchantia paleacea]